MYSTLYLHIKIRKFDNSFFEVYNKRAVVADKHNLHHQIVKMQVCAYMQSKIEYMKSSIKLIKPHKIAANFVYVHLGWFVPKSDIATDCTDYFFLLKLRSHIRHSSWNIRKDSEDANPKIQLTFPNSRVKDSSKINKRKIMTLTIKLIWAI